MTGRTGVARLAALAECAEVLPGFSIAGRMEDDPDGTHQVLITRHLREGVPYEYAEADSLRIVPGRDAKKYEIGQGDAVFMSRGSRNRTWAIKAVPVPTIVPVSFYILRPATGVEARYLAWYLNQQPAQAAIDQLRTGAGTPIVQREAFKQLQVVLPPLETQRTIADLGDLQVREQELRTRLAGATQRMQSAGGRQIIEQLRREAKPRRTS